MRSLLIPSLVVSSLSLSLLPLRRLLMTNFQFLPGEQQVIQFSNIVITYADRSASVFSLNKRPNPEHTLTNSENWW